MFWCSQKAGLGIFQGSGWEGELHHPHLHHKHKSQASRSLGEAQQCLMSPGNEAAADSLQEGCTPGQPTHRLLTPSTAPEPGALPEKQIHSPVSVKNLSRTVWSRLITTITESQNSGGGRDLWRSSRSTLLARQGHLEQVTQEHVQGGLEWLQRAGLDGILSRNSSL